MRERATGRAHDDAREKLRTMTMSLLNGSPKSVASEQVLHAASHEHMRSSGRVMCSELDVRALLCAAADVAVADDDARVLQDAAWLMKDVGVGMA